METKCPNCGAPLENGMCLYCGYKSAMAQTEMHSAPNLGVQTIQVAVHNVPEVSDKSWIATLLLCIFFGLIGGHKFYEGKIGMGIIYLFTAGIFGIGVIVDLIKIILKSETDKYGRQIVN